MDAMATTSKVAVCAMVVLVLLKEGAYATPLVPAPLQDRARSPGRGHHLHIVDRSSCLAPWKSSIGSFSFVSCQEIFKLVRSIDMISTVFVCSIRYD